MDTRSIVPLGQPSNTNPSALIQAKELKIKEETDAETKTDARLFSLYMLIFLQ